MAEKKLYFNGIDGRTGKYLLPPMTSREVSALGLSATTEESLERQAWFKSWVSRHAADDSSRAPVLDCDPRNLAETGWGVIYAPGTSWQVKQALSKLLEHRREQAGEHNSSYFQEYEYRSGETTSQFLRRNGAKVGGTADPDRVPYYLLIVGSPEEIPFQFQSELDVSYAVGRLHFDNIEDYETYASSVVDAETGKRRPRLSRQVSFFGVRNEGDSATRQTADELVGPLTDTLVEPGKKDWDVLAYLGPKADKEQLSRLLGGPETPALLFTASHGLRFPPDDARQLDRQGALVCQDWPGPGDENGVDQDQYFTGDDLSPDAHLHGLVAFLFACYSGGTPWRDNFEQKVLGKPPEIAPHAFVSRLSQRLLSHGNGGALAVVGHVDRTWTTSFAGSEKGEGVDVFRNTLRRLLAGHTVGWAMEYFNQTHAALAAELSNLWESQHFLEAVDPEWFSDLWMAHNDARNFVVLGDPAVKLAGT
jgi:hypothetical protein